MRLRESKPLTLEVNRWKAETTLVLQTLRIYNQTIPSVFRPKIYRYNISLTIQESGN